MTKLTRCDLRRRALRLMRSLTILRVICVLVLLGAFAFGQIYLRFRIRDLQIETRKLQSRRENLENQKKTLISDVEKLKRFETVRDYAERELGLRKCPADATDTARVSARAVAFWQDAAKSVRVADSSSAQDDLLVAVGERVLEWSHGPVARGPESR